MRLLVIELSHSSGTRTVLRKVLPRFSELFERVTYCGHDETTWKNQPGIEALSFGELICLFQSFPDRLYCRIGGAKAKQRIFWNYIERLINHSKITHVFLPWVIGCSIPRLSVPTGAMLMDLLWRHFPEDFREDQMIESTLIQNLRNVDVVFPVSDSTASEVAIELDLKGLNIVSVPHGAEIHSDKNPMAPLSTELPVEFFFYPAQTTANKNHQRLFEAVRILANRNVAVCVVCSSRSITRLREGHVATSHEFSLRKWLDKHEYLLKKNILLIGEVSWLELQSLYRGCRAVILPSEYEGFGLPLVEAFERNLPVICSRIAPFLEQIKRYDMQDRTTIVDSLNPEELALAMETALASTRPHPLEQSDLKHRLQAWTWDHAARAYYTALTDIS